MRKVEDYQRHAEECRLMLRQATTDEHKQMLQRMIDTWESLARDRTAQLERQQRMSELENGQA